MSDDNRAGEDLPDIERLLMRRMAEYVELWERAAAKLKDSSYRSEDLVDDYFRFWGKATRDMTAGAALLWNAGTNPGSLPPDAHDGDTTGRADDP